MPYPWSVREALLARLATGERISHICRDPAMPCHEAVTGWARREPLFAEMYAAAKRQGAARRQAFHEPTAKVLLQRLADGELVRDVLRDPAMPRRELYDHWRRTQNEFNARILTINEGRAALADDRARRRRTRPFDPALADRIVAKVASGVWLEDIRKVVPEAPGRRVLDRWRRQDRDFDRALRAAIRFTLPTRRCKVAATPRLLEAVFEALAAGATLNALSRRPGMPSPATFSRWQRTRPDFARAVEEARRCRMEALGDRAIAIAEARGPLSETAREIRRLTGMQDRMLARRGPGWPGGYDDEADTD